MTYKYILQRLMDRVTNEHPNVDNREGSIVYNALASAAMELAIKYVELEQARANTFVQTASREYALIGCEQMGMDTSVFDAKVGIHKAYFNIEVPIASRWNCGMYNYTVSEYIGIEDGYHAYRMVVETVGTEANSNKGDLMPITSSPAGLEYAKLVECLIEGEDYAPIEDIKNSYSSHVNGTKTDGNVAQYENWCATYAGIGNYKIIPLWNGKNTVKVSILSVSNRRASEELIAEFQEYLDPNCEGMGNGVAPIGAFVTVSTATEVPISVTANVILKEGFSDTSVIDKAISDYFAEIAYQKSVLSYMKLGAIIQDAEGVDFITNLVIDGYTEDISFGEEEIPTLGNTNWTVTS